MPTMAKRPLALRIDEDLLVRVDEARGDVSRTRFVERALESALAGDATGGRSGGSLDQGATHPPASSRAPKKVPSIADTWRR